MLDLSKLTVEDAKLVQHGLKVLGFYDGTTRGFPGPKTQAAYDRHLASFETAASPEGESISDALVRILRKEVGIVEHPKNSNRGKRVEEYQTATWLDGSGWPWCAAFICWGLREVGKEIDLPFARPETAAAYGFENWAKDEGLKLYKPRSTIRKGDILMFTFSHIGVAIEDERNAMVRTVEGNTDTSGSREGGGVYEKTRGTYKVRSHIRIS